MNRLLQTNMIITLVLLSSCSQETRYRKTVENGIITVPRVSEMVRIFANAPTDHFIGQASWDPAGPVMWNTQVFFGGRYQLTYQVRIWADYKRGVVLGTNSPPMFYLLEVGQTDGKATTSSAGWEISEAQWEKVVTANGDFSVVGIQLKTNEPVANWDAFVEASRARWRGQSVSNN